MPEKLHKCVDELIKKGYTEKEAWAICRSKIKDKVIFDKAATIEKPEMNAFGFLTAKAIIARTGIQQYLDIELGIGNEGKIINVYRPAEEVLSEDSLKSFINLPITDEHPSEFITPDNYFQYVKGSISGIDVIDLDDGEKGILATITIYARDLIDKINNGKKELSVGYLSKLIKEEGEYKGTIYQYKQTDIIANHLAVVEAGRCGGACRIIDKKQFDSKAKTDNNKNKLIPGGYVMDDKKLAAILDEKSQEIAKLQDNMKKLQDELNKSKEVIKELKDEKAKIEAERDNLKKQLEMKDNEMKEKAKLILIAKDCGVDVDIAKDNLEIKKEIAKALDIDIEGKDEAYLDAGIDLRLKEMKNKKEKFKKQYQDAGNFKFSVDWQEIANKELKF